VPATTALSSLAPSKGERKMSEINGEGVPCPQCDGDMLECATGNRIDNRVKYEFSCPSCGHLNNRQFFWFAICKQDSTSYLVFEESMIVSNDIRQKTKAIAKSFLYGRERRTNNAR